MMRLILNLAANGSAQIYANYSDTFFPYFLKHRLRGLIETKGRKKNFPKLFESRKIHLKITSIFRALHNFLIFIFNTLNISRAEGLVYMNLLTFAQVPVLHYYYVNEKEDNQSEHQIKLPRHITNELRPKIRIKTLV